LPGFDHDHAAFDAVLDGAVTEAGVRYELLASRRPALDAYVESLADAPVATFDRDQRMAFWIDAYNALTLVVVLEERPRSMHCAAKGCPPLSPDAFTAGGLDAQLDAAARRWVATNAYRLEGDTVHLSMIFDWYGEDFAPSRGDIAGVDGEAEAALWWISAHGGPARLTSGGLAAAWIPYDWGLNAVP
jgi:hypothetical protein